MVTLVSPHVANSFGKESTTRPLSARSWHREDSRFLGSWDLLYFPGSARTTYQLNDFCLSRGSLGIAQLQNATGILGD